MNSITKQNFLKQLQINTNSLLNTLSQNNVSNSTTDFMEVIKNENGETLSDISFLTNGGDCRSIKLFVYTKNEKKNNANFMIKLEDESIGCGRYTHIFNELFGSTFAWQTDTFDMKHNIKLYQLDSKRNTAGTEIELLEEVDTILFPLYKLFFRTEQMLSNYYSDKNIENNLEAFNKRKEEIQIYEDKYIIKDMVNVVSTFEPSTYFNH